MKNKRILFTTVTTEIPDYLGNCSPYSPFRFSLKIPSLGLRFLKENIPDINIIEYPDEKEFLLELRRGRPEILGISFHMCEIPIARKMAEIARREGVKEIWGGNHGVLSSESQKFIDRCFYGYSEYEIYKEIYDYELPELKHPFLDSRIGIYPFLKGLKYGFIISTRGCRHNCSFCQKIDLKRGIDPVPISSIEKILMEYKKNGIHFIYFINENFLGNKDHDEKILSLLKKHQFVWGCCTRAENIKGRVKELKELGMMNCLIGVESLNNNNFSSIKKGMKQEVILDTISELKMNNIHSHVSYMFGFEEDTVKSVKADIIQLLNLGVTTVNLSILTPFPGTQLWDELSDKYGILNTDYSKFDSFNLSWNHPEISYEEMQELLTWGYRKCFTHKTLLNSVFLMLKNGSALKLCRMTLRDFI